MTLTVHEDLVGGASIPEPACRPHVNAGHDPWHPPGHETQQQRAKRVREATAICATCPYRAECLQAAHNDPDKGGEGIWGGKTPRMRQQPSQALTDGGGKPCPSWAAISRHQARGEKACDACRDFRNAYQRERRSA